MKNFLRAAGVELVFTFLFIAGIALVHFSLTSFESNLLIRFIMLAIGIVVVLYSSSYWNLATPGIFIYENKNFFAFSAEILKDPITVIKGAVLTVIFLVAWGMTKIIGLGSLVTFNILWSIMFLTLAYLISTKQLKKSMQLVMNYKAKEFAALIIFLVFPSLVIDIIVVVIALLAFAAAMNLILVFPIILDVLKILLLPIKAFISQMSTEKAAKFVIDYVIFIALIPAYIIKSVLIYAPVIKYLKAHKYIQPKN